MKTFGKKFRIAVVSYRYSVEVSPTLKNICSYLYDHGFGQVDVFVDRLYRKENYRAYGANIITLLDKFLDWRPLRNLSGSPAEKKAFQIFLRENLVDYDVVFAAEFSNVAMLHNAGFDLSRVVCLNLEGADSIRHGKDLPIERLLHCAFFIAPSKERADDLQKYLGANLDFEYLPVSLRPVELKGRSHCDELNIIYSGYFAEWAGLLEFLEAYRKSGAYEYSSLLLQGHSMGTDGYLEAVRKDAEIVPRLKIDTSFYEDKDYMDLLAKQDVGIAFYKNLEGTENFTNLIFSSGKIASYLWSGLAVLTNVEAPETKEPPFIYVRDFSEHEIKQGLHYVRDNRKLFRDSAYELASKKYNFDTCIKRIVERVSKLCENRLHATPTGNSISLLSNTPKEYRPDKNDAPDKGQTYADLVKENSIPKSNVLDSRNCLCNNLTYNADAIKPGSEKLYEKNLACTETSENIIQQLRKKGLLHTNQPLRLHLGCGQNHFDGYINIDYPPSEHNIIRVKADIYADIKSLYFPSESVDEIRLHHVFEHFNRGNALALLVRWHEWLKVGGKLHIETPDVFGSAKMLASNVSYKIKQGILRHIFGSHEADWAYHYDGWYEDKFRRILSSLGFEVTCHNSQWQREPYLANVEVFAIKRRNMSREQLLTVCDQLLLDSKVDDIPAERKMHEIWMKDVRAFLDNTRSAQTLSVQNIRVRQAMNNIGGLIFSKDRTMQLRATLESLFLHCKDCDKISLTVIYKVSNLLYRQQYDDLKKRFGNVTFIEEQDFKQQTLGVIGTFEYILFLVDDNLFVRDFCLADVVRVLRYNHDAIGFSLRLGRNTDYCYMLSSQQALPKLRQAGSGILKYYWPGRQYDFGYPLEVSSSVYRVRDILEMLVQLEFSNPNTLEGQMAANSQLYSQARSSILCYECSVTFCNPVNVVQHVYDQNRAGANPNYTSERLAQLYRQGLAIDVTRYDGFVSNGVHQEVQLYFGKKGGDEIRISVVIPCYNQAHYLPEAVESIVNQTYTNWQCIIVNDGSSDNTSEVAGELIKKYSNHDIRLIEKPNGGVADARNTGIDAAESDWVLLLDSDDMFERTFMQKAIDIIRREPKTDIVFANLQQFGADSGEWIPDEYSKETIPVKNTIPYASLYRKELWHKVGGYDRVLGKVLQLEDWTFWISCSQYNPVVRRIPEKLFLYRVHSSNIYYQLIKPNRRVAEALIVTAYPNLYSPPAVVRAWKLIANCPEQIYQRILRTIEMYPECGLPYLWRGLRYQQQGRIDEAIRDYQAAVQKAGEDDWQCFVCLACLQERVGDMPGARDNIEKVLTIRGDFNWVRDMLPDAARQSNSTESQTGRQKILFYFDRIGNLNETSPAGTVIAILNFARALQSNNPEVEIHITGDLVHYPEQYESFRVIPLSPPEQREQFITDYDVVFFATHVRYFKGLTKPSGQIWVLWQHCWEADDRVSLSHSSDFDIVICLSELHRASLRDRSIGDEKLITIPNLIDTDVYSPKDVRRKNHSIMFAGGLNPHKCVHVLMDAFRLVRQQVEDAELHIYGDGQMWRGGNTYGNGLKSIKPDGTYFHGYVDNKDMPQIYSKHSILCLPSKHESFGLVTVEAQACGCVPVVHNAGGVAATLADGQTGLLYSPNTPEKLAETIIKAIKIVDADPSVRQKAIDFVRNTFSINRAAEYISKLWDRITVAKKVNTIRTLLEGNEIEQADFECEKLLQKYPNHPDVQLLHALIMLRQGNEQKANLVIEELLENFPNHLRVLNDCGLMAMKAGDKEKALRYFTRAYKFNPWDKNTTTNCYAILTTSGKYRDAKMLLLNYLTNVGEDAQVLQLFREIDNLIANAGLGTNVVSQEVLDNRQGVYCRSSTSKPLVSIIMPVYNGADYIGQAIESVLAQEYPNFELVIIDDGSTDNTKEVILRYNDERIRYLYQENKGVSSARNLAINKAKGQYIMPLDADDMMTPDFIAKHLAEFEKHPDVDLVYCDVLLIDGNGNQIRIMNKPEYQDRRYLIRDLLRAGHPVVPFRLGIRRSVFDKIGFYDEDLLIGEDYDMMRRFVKAGLKAHHLSEPLHLRRMYADSLSRNCSAQKAKSHFEVIKRFIDTFAYDELFPDVAWDEIAPQMRQLHAKCLTAGTYLAIGQDYVKTKATECSRTAFDLACSELNDCVKMDPGNQALRQLLQKSKLIRAGYTEAPQQVVSK